MNEDTDCSSAELLIIRILIADLQRNRQDILHNQNYKSPVIQLEAPQTSQVITSFREAAKRIF